MTVSSTTTKSSGNGDGSNNTFPYAFKVFDQADLKVIIRSSAGTETVKTITTHYTVTGVGNAGGGNVVFTSGNIPVTGETVVIRREAALTQATDYVANDPFPAAAHEDALDKLTFLAQQQQEEIDRSIKLSRTNTMTSTEFTVGATTRANKILAFDNSGEISVTQELGTFKGTDATVTTEAYVVRDLVKSSTTAQLNNVYICVADSVVGDSLTDTDHFALIVDAVSAATSATNAATSASNASTSESNASTSETNASASATKAENYAVKTDGEAETGVGEASAKAHAIGDDGSLTTGGTGPAKDWAIKTNGVVDSGSEYSAKEYAVGSNTAQTSGSAKQWAIGGGAAFDRDTAVSGSEYSAKYWANQAANSAKDQRDVYYGGFSSDSAAQTYQTGTNLGTVDAGDIYFNTSSNILRVYNGSSWDDAVVSTTGFASNGFAVAMAIAL